MARNMSVSEFARTLDTSKEYDIVYSDKDQDYFDKSRGIVSNLRFKSFTLIEESGIAIVDGYSRIEFRYVTGIELINSAAGTEMTITCSREIGKRTRHRIFII